MKTCCGYWSRENLRISNFEYRILDLIPTIRNSQSEIRNFYMTQIAKNKKARFEYEILETLEAGIVLVGTEVKSIRAGKVQLSDSHAVIKDGEVLLLNLHIASYEGGNQFNHEELRPRKLLLHAKEISKLIGKLKERGLSCVPLSMYWKNNRVKVEIAVVKGKKLHDKREDTKKKDAMREIDRALKKRT